MVTDIPLDLLFEVQQAAEKNQRLILINGDPNQPTWKGYYHYAVPIGFGWSGKGDNCEPVIMYRTYENKQYSWVGCVPLRSLREVTTIPSRTPGRKAIQLWQAKWAVDSK